MPLIELEGFREMDRALRELSLVVERDMQAELIHASEPVRIRTEELGISEISGMKRKKSIDWTQMVLRSTQSGVYMAPAHRRTVGTPRRTLAALLMNKAMVPGAEQEIDKVAVKVDAIIDRALTRVGF